MAVFALSFVDLHMGAPALNLDSDFDVTVLWFCVVGVWMSNMRLNESSSECCYFTARVSVVEVYSEIY